MSPIAESDLDSVDLYESSLQQINTFQSHGPLGVKVLNGKFIPCSLMEKIQAYARVLFSSLLKKPACYFDAHRALLQANIQYITQVQEKITEGHSCSKAYFSAAQIVQLWNQRFGMPQGISGTIQQKMLTLAGWNWKTEFQDRLTISYREWIPALQVQLPGDLFHCSWINHEKLPLVLSPKKSKVELSELIQWAERHPNELKSILSAYGGILLRGFPIHEAHEFAAVCKAVCGKALMNYSGGEGSRTKVAQGVYTSTEAPPGFKIPLHNELTCTDSPAQIISFFCKQAPAKGSGQTILAKTNKISESLQKKKSTWELFEKRTIKYISRHPPEGNIFNKINITHKTWQNSFETEDKSKVEEICREKRFEYRWIKKWIEVTRRAPATIQDPEHPDSSLWFNQAHLYHPNPVLRGGWLTHFLASLVYFQPHTRQYDVEFDDGSQIPKEAVYDIYKVLDEETIQFDWNQGDVLILDNYKTLHGRNPYKGQRLILTSLIR